MAREHGLVVVTFSDARLFIASGYLGDAAHDYLCGQVGSEVLSVRIETSARLFKSSWCLDMEIIALGYFHL